MVMNKPLSQVLKHPLLACFIKLPKNVLWNIHEKFSWLSLNNKYKNKKSISLSFRSFAP